MRAVVQLKRVKESRMGLDIEAYSRLRLVPHHPPQSDDDDDDGFVDVYVSDVADRLGGLPPGTYAPLTQSDVWWAGEHGTALPDEERPRVDAHVAEVLKSGRAECPGDAAVLAARDFKSERMSFRAGSYSGYNRWRQTLCIVMLDCEPDEVWSDPQLFAGRPFVELINFSDAEGCIAGTVAAKLSKDFVTHRARIDQAPDSAFDSPEAKANFIHVYECFTEGFALAADRGVLVFC